MTAVFWIELLLWCDNCKGDFSQMPVRKTGQTKAALISDAEEEGWVFMSKGDKEVTLCPKCGKE